ncbi:MAG TPA: DUF4159 domain-containing protein [Roseiarcus sp.]|nr:DUF4159 domain-containing protein [Roseiarcus sp.]
MFGLPLAFVAPAALAALAGLVGLYWLLRVTPPRPRRQIFPPVRLLLGLAPKQTTAFRTPWPLLLLRLAIAALVILAMAGPVWRALSATGAAKGPLLIVLDDGWPAAPTWESRIALASEAAEGAARAGRPVALAALSRGPEEIVAAAGEAVQAKLAALTPAPYAPPRAPAEKAVAGFLAAHPDAQTLWIADGLDFGQEPAFARLLASHSAEVAADPQTALALVGAQSLPAALDVSLARAGASGRARGTVRAYDARGRGIGAAAFDFGDKTTATARFALPLELRNDISRLAIDGEAAAGAVWLVDERAKRRRVAVVAGAELHEPLLAPTYYITRALAPFADVREAKPGAADPIADLLAEQPSALALADMNIGPGPDHDKIAAFVEAGGVLIRFAGVRTAAADDDLLPVALRRGGRTLGGALSWETPKHVAAFEPPSPFVGLKAPQEVTVSRQVLAEPTEGLPDKTWARLVDGTPLVTAVRRGKGLIVLFHVTADTTWSNLPLSGLFVDMLKRIVAEASAAAPAPGAGATVAAKTAAPPWRTLDGFGALGAPPASAKPLPPGFADAADAEHPPGFYGVAESAYAVNALADGASLKAADYSGLKARPGGLKIAPPRDLKPWALLLAFLGFLVDAVASLNLRRSSLRWGAAAPLALALLWLAPAPQARAAAISNLEAATATRLAYVATGDAEVDETSRLGLEQLTRTLDQRTSASLAEPVAVDPARDELAFYPLIYWPIAANRPQPPQAAVSGIAAFMRNGGTVIFDTRDALTSRPGEPPSPETLWLRTLLKGVDIPVLEPVPRDHVVTKTFYLLNGFVGRTENGQTWIEALPPIDPKDRVNRPARAGDNVSPVIITSNDLAAAWAAREDGAPLYPLIPGGPRQREMALRGGVNLVMYALTGNYKADQVHARDLLERLSR